MFQAVFSFRKNGGDLCSTSLILSITFFRFPEILSSRRVKVTVQFFMSAEEVYAPLCPACQSLSSPFRNTSGIASQSHYSVLYERGRLMLLFSHPVNHFFRPCETLFRLCAVLKSLPLRETRTCPKGGQVSTKFFFFYQFVATLQRQTPLLRPQERLFPKTGTF